MASTSSTIRLIFEGSTSGIQSAVASVRTALRGVREDENGYFRNSLGQFARHRQGWDGIGLSIGGVHGRLGQFNGTLGISIGLLGKGFRAGLSAVGAAAKAAASGLLLMTK